MGDCQRCNGSGVIYVRNARSYCVCDLGLLANKADIDGQLGAIDGKNEAWERRCLGHRKDRWHFGIWPSDNR